MSIFWTRTILITTSPLVLLILVWAFLSTLVAEVWKSLWYAQNEVRIEFGVLRRYWREGFKRSQP